MANAAGDLANAAQTVSSAAPKSSGKEAPATDFTYDLSEDGNGVVIKKYTGNGGALVIPAAIEGLPVVELDSLAFYGEGTRDYGPGRNITSVVIPATVKKVGSVCFLKIEKLTSVTFLGSDVELAGPVFRDCINLSELKLPNGDNVLKPKSYTLANGETSFEGSAFQGCKKLPLAVRSKLKAWGFDEP